MVVIEYVLSAMVFCELDFLVFLLLCDCYWLFLKHSVVILEYVLSIVCLSCVVVFGYTSIDLVVFKYVCLKRCGSFGVYLKLRVF